jgi:hypothetical protein
MREMNKRKGDKYDELQKKYNAHYEASEHGIQCRQEYREKQKELRIENRTWRVNPTNRLRISISNRICRILGPIKNSTALQYIGVTINILKNWIEYNFDSDIKWDNFGSAWTIDLVDVDVDLTTEKGKFDRFNWRLWYPRKVGSEPHDFRDRSAEFLDIPTM